MTCLALLVSATACGGTPQGAPSTTATSVPTTTGTHRPLPPRPREISLKGVDPCQVLTDQQLAQLRYSKTRLPDTGNRLGEAQCSVGNTFGSSPNYGSLISLVVNEDITEWFTPDRQAGLSSTNKITVAGFPALEITGKQLRDDCQVLVDVTNGEYLDVLSNPRGERGTSPEPYCVEAKRVAELAMQTLLARK
ncbi:DUF3558 domain-containing protein [Allokutzneria sp. A3M-2-11 16]|uniref:DUF3558 domain-containing protein n=1 Tax=Allokutzneria sp. A3M-2-11 16 TaxID=2962043 RepID=UPI0020B801B9|nr:DUF3558 domain-containing protein [Allokutzneria sp. A3M-2-11 16]MCP3800378.1 DUF3558 domain-containing protein [Allokutzneria sp. A3M-2-11 16]